MAVEVVAEAAEAEVAEVAVVVVVETAMVVETVKIGYHVMSGISSARKRRNVGAQAERIVLEMVAAVTTILVRPTIPMSATTTMAMVTIRL
jgi:hypothetical protein